MNEKFEILAETIVNYSIKVEEKENILITVEKGVSEDLINKLIEKILQKNAGVLVKIIDNEISAFLNSKLTENQILLSRANLEHEVKTYNSFITICYSTNDHENKNVNLKMLNKYHEITENLDDIRINKKKWVLLNYPSLLDAHKAKMTTKEFFDFALDTMCFDYHKLYDLMLPLKELMEDTDKVRIVSKNTDITFSIKAMPAIICAGEFNIPDGEVFTAPIKTSVNGKITYNTPSPYRDNVYNNISLEFKDGKIINATCNEDNDKLNEIFDTDEGSRYIGEFAIGINPLIRKPMGDILFDEKIYGSIHFTPGMAYAEAFNGNKSAIHWDLVLIQTKDYGGGEIYFDDVLIRKDGKFVIDSLKPLNFDEK